MSKEEKVKKCDNPECECKNCTCEDCECENGECNCENCEGNEKIDCNETNNKETEHDYLKDLQRVQAEFDNYRKRTLSNLADARTDGFIEAVTGFLPALDSFKMATNMITDKNTLLGIQFIEKGILDTLSKMGVNVIDTTGKFDPNFHQAIDTEDVEGFESGDIIKEAYKGFTYKDKVIRYSQVVVKK